jgi:hypothetical protein
MSMAARMAARIAAQIAAQMWVVKQLGMDWIEIGRLSAKPQTAPIIKKDA